MSYVARADVQETNAKTLKVLPPNGKAKMDASDYFSTFGQKMLGEVSGISQFFDRDADPEVARVGMEVMVKLMEPGADLAEGLERIEKTRKSVYRK